MAVITTIRSAFGFLTRLPVGPWPLQNDLNGISAWLPLVGLVVGGLAGGLTWTATLLFPPLVCGTIGWACWVAVTGGLHLDGVADCGDGLPIEVSRERRLEIMKDSRLGTFGGTALFFNLAFKGAALATLAAHGTWELLLTACALAGLLARSQIFIAMRFPGARPGGMGEAFKQGTRPGHALAAAAVTLAACALAGWNGLYALLSALAMVACSVLFSWFIDMSSRYSLVYGSLASLIILLVWLYLCGNIREDLDSGLDHLCNPAKI